jgi:HSP20 family protein
MPVHPFAHKGFGETGVPDFRSESSVCVKAGPEGNLQLTARIPGLRAHEIDLDVSGDMLTLRGEQRRSLTRLTGRRDRRRQDLGPFRRAFALPRGTNREQIDASFREDVLTVTIPLSA